MPLATLDIDPEYRRDLLRYFAVGAVFYLLAALVSVGFFHPDQHFQTLEFAHLKVNPGHEDGMVWEYHSRIRPWTQPYAYVAIISAMKALGIDNPFIHDAVIRILTGAIGMAALYLFAVSLAPWMPHSGQRRWLAIAFGLFWLFPFHFTRTSSETASSIFLLLGLSALVLLRKDPIQDMSFQSESGPFSGPLHFSVPGLILSGLSLGMMFNTRYQMGFAIVAVTLWMLLIQKTPFRQLVLFSVAVLLMVGIGIWLDTVGYGAFELVPWNYLRVNLIEGKAASFGTDPWYFYILSMLIQPVGPVLLVVTLRFWWKYPKNIITWVTLLTVLAHMAISHKEIRFLIPVSPLIVAALVFAIPEKWFLLNKTGNPFLGHKRWVKWTFFFFVTINMLVLVITSIRPPRPEVSVHQFIYSIEPEHFEFYSLGATPYLYYQTNPPHLEFYAPAKVTQHSLGSYAELGAVLREHSPIYFFHPDNTRPVTAEAEVLRKHCHLIYQSYGPAWDKWTFGRLPELLKSSRLKTATIYRCQRNPQQ